MQWINATRPGATLASAFFAIASFRYSNLPINWLIVVTVYIVAILAMLWNDFYDRYSDIKKGRALAFKQPVKFLCFTIFVGLIALILILAIFMQNVVFGYWICFLFGLSLIYPYTQKNYLAKNIIVAAAVANAVIFPWFINGAPRVLLIWAIIFLVISARELLKDIEDIIVDLGVKNTLATNFGARFAITVSASNLAIASIVATLSFTMPFVSIFVFSASLILLCKRNIQLAKLWIDVGLLSLIAMAIFQL